jgi:transposase
MESRVELFARIRRDARAKGLSIRCLAREHRVSRRNVRQALAAAEPPERRIPAREAPKLGPLKSVIDAMFLADLDAPRKQRHTAQRIFDRLVDEHQAVISYSAVRQYVKARRTAIAVESGNVPVEVFVPQEHAPGAEAEVDFGDVWVDLAGVRTPHRIANGFSRFPR